jgi:hypothetical protein
MPAADRIKLNEHATAALICAGCKMHVLPGEKHLCAALSAKIEAKSLAEVKKEVKEVKVEAKSNINVDVKNKEP